ncbi:MAG: ABC transporter ATP-binding protein [Phycisphaeraceae bacterium]
MSQIAIQVQGLSKRYRLGGAPGCDRSFREMVTDRLGALGACIVGRKRGPRADARDFWALQDVSFDVARGEVVGIIGHNGAGKSTLLKLLSRITDPTTGQAIIHGRVGSLLEVGTGFHPELTGRENIYLNGAILGMSRHDVRRQFDRIVEFAEVEKFLDTPVKRYSSGMYVRLAFAVAAHLEPDILIVDEVLAVGDAAFQRKCLGRMGEAAREGRTVLFVSHNMTAVKALCQRAVLLQAGRITAQGDTNQVIQHYLQQGAEMATTPVSERHDRRGDGSTRIEAVRIENIEPGIPITTGCRLRVILDYAGALPLRQSRCLVGIYDTSNTGIFLLDSDAGNILPEALPATGQLVCVTEPINATAGRCYLNVALKKAGVLADHVTHAVTFDIESGDTFGLRQMPGRDWVMCLLRQQWLVASSAEQRAQSAATFPPSVTSLAA